MKFLKIPLVFLIISLIQLSSSFSKGSQKKVLFIDSYHEEYIWSGDITAGIRSVLDPREDIDLKIFRMDTKRNQTEAFKREAAEKARALIESWKPDVVIASDDNASKYLIAPYYKNTDLPVVFCGLNWDASIYGFPAENITGMVEIALIRPTLKSMQKYAKGDRIGYLASDTVSERKEYANIVKRFDLKPEVRFIKTFAQLKEAYLELQKVTDMVLIQECRSVKDFNHLEMVEFVRHNTQVPTGAMQKYLIHYALITFAKSGEEQGQFAAKAALDILGGKLPKNIPVTENKKASIFLNMKLARTMGIKFPIELVKNGHMISAEQKKLLYVNSYHAGFRWSDEIEMGLLKALHIIQNEDGTFDDSNSDVKLKLYRMDTKLNTSLQFKQQAALTAKKIIDDWEPDIIITSDDNAAKFLVAPYLKDSHIPVVYCGLNWNADIYNFPVDHITGMVEVNPILETIEMLKQYVDGEHIGYIAQQAYSEEKELQHLQDVLHIRFTDGGLVSDFEQWKELYLRLQETVDMIILFSPSGIAGWNDDKAYSFIMENTKIPTGSTGDNNSRYALLGKVKIAEEQGWWAGHTALRILEGTKVKDIPPTTNKNSRIFLNMNLAKKLNIKFPMELLEKATMLEN